MVDSLYWTWGGRYGDDNEYILLACKPEDLSPEEQAAIREAVEKGFHEPREINPYPMGYDLQDKGFLREAGNAWHHNIIWAPQVHEWLGKKGSNDPGLANRRA